MKALFIASLLALTAGCAGTEVEESTTEPTVAAAEASTPEEENLGQTTSALCLHRCIVLPGGCRMCFCESGDARVFCYANVAAAASMSPSSDPAAREPSSADRDRVSP